MKRFTILWSHQLWQMFIAPSTYIAAFMFLTFMAVMYLFSLVDISMSASDVSPLGKFLSVFWVPVLFMVPLLTMRSIAEERRMGTLATLMTTPVTAGQIVLAKFLACYFFYILLWIMTLFFPLITELYIPNSIRAAGLMPMSQLLTGYGFIFISGAMYIAIGIFASSLTRTTLVAGMLSFGMLFLRLSARGSFQVRCLIAVLWPGCPSIDYLQTFRHLEDFSNSLLDTRPFFLYISTACMLLAVTSLITEAKNA
ncbi:MAG: ABC transporter permease [Bacilli bacterium]